MPLDPKEFEKVFANHFETIDPEQFLNNLKAACPYLFNKDSIVALQDINSQEDRIRNRASLDLDRSTSDAVGFELK